MSAEDTTKLAKRRNIVLVFMGSALAFALLFLILAIRYHAETEKEEQQAAQAEASQAATPLTLQQQQAAAQYARQNGEQIDYADFYAKALSANLVIGKRYRFRADITKALFLNDPYAPSGVYRQLEGYAAFDKNAQYEAFLKSNSQSGEVVASLGSDGRIMIHRVN